MMGVFDDPALSALFRDDDEPAPPPRPLANGHDTLPDNPPEFEALGAVWADDITLDIDKPGLVDGLLGTAAMSVVYGESGSGKTFAAVDFSCHVAAGLPWRSMKVQKGVVVYVAAESPTSIKRRIWAWKQRHGVEHLDVLVVTASVNLLNGDTDKVVALVRRVRERTGKPVALVVVDTLARAMVGNENSPEDMGAFVAACGRIREAADGHVMVVHHSGKDQARGARGHSSLRAATDVEMEVTKGEEVRQLTVRKNRDGEEGATYGFKLETFELGTNAAGRMVTTCVAAAVDPSDEAVTSVTRVTPGPALGPNQKVVREALAAAIADKGRDAPAARDIPRRARVVTVEEWREYALRYLPQPEVKQKGQAFKRAMEWLVAHRLVRHVAGLVWLPTSAGHTGHMGHMTPDVTVCDPAQTTGHTGHTGHTPLKGCDPCDRVTDEGRGEEEKEGSALSGPREGEVPALDTGTEPPVVTQPDVTDVAGATGTLLPGRLVDTGDPRPESPLAKRRELLADDAGRLVTLVYESAYRSPIVETVRLHRFHLVTSTWRDEVTASLDITQQDSVRPRRRKRYSIDRKMPSPIMVIEGAVGIEPRPCPDERRLFDDWDVFRDVWEDVAAQARVAGRPVLFDSVAVTVEHEMQEIPRRNAENAAREAFCREAGWEELP